MHSGDHKYLSKIWKNSKWIYTYPKKALAGAKKKLAKARVERLIRKHKGNRYKKYFLNGESGRSLARMEVGRKIEKGRDEYGGYYRANPGQKYYVSYELNGPAWNRKKNHDYDWRNSYEWENSYSSREAQNRAINDAVNNLETSLGKYAPLKEKIRKKFRKNR